MAARRYHPGEGYDTAQLRTWAEREIESGSAFASPDHQAAVGVLVLLDQLDLLLATSAQLVNAEPSDLLKTARLKAELGLLVTALDPGGELLAARSLRSVS